MVSAPLPVLSVTEWRLLTALWETRQADAKTLSSILKTRFQLHYSPKTTGVLLARLAQKGHLRVSVNRSEPGRPVHLYSPVLSREQALEAQFSHLFKEYAIHTSDAAILVALLNQLDSPP